MLNTVPHCLSQKSKSENSLKQTENSRGLIRCVPNLPPHYINYYKVVKESSQRNYMDP